MSEIDIKDRLILFRDTTADDQLKRLCREAIDEITSLRYRARDAAVIVRAGLDKLGGKS